MMTPLTPNVPRPPGSDRSTASATSASPWPEDEPLRVWDDVLDGRAGGGWFFFRGAFWKSALAHRLVVVEERERERESAARGVVERRAVGQPVRTGRSLWRWRLRARSEGKENVRPVAGWVAGGVGAETGLGVQMGEMGMGMGSWGFRRGWGL